MISISSSGMIISISPSGIWDSISYAFNIEYMLAFTLGILLIWLIIHQASFHVMRKHEEKEFLIIENKEVASRENLLDAAKQQKMDCIYPILRKMKKENHLNHSVLISLYRILISRKLTKECLTIHSSYPSDDIHILRIILACTVEEGLYEQMIQIFRLIDKRADQRDWHTRMRGSRSAPDVSEDALNVLIQMEVYGATVPQSTYILVFNACIKDGKLKEAEHLLEKNITNDVVYYNTLMRMYTRKKHSLDDVLRVFYKIKQNAVPSAVTYGTILHACVNSNQLDLATKFEREMIAKGMELNLVHQTTLIKGLCKEKKVDQALEMFENISNPDLVTYSTIIKALADSKRLPEVFVLLERLESQSNLVLDEIVYNSVLFGCVQTSNVPRARSTFERMQRVGIAPTAATISTMLKLYLKANLWDEAIWLLAELHKYKINPAPRLFRQVILGLCRPRQGRKVVEVYNLFRRSLHAFDGNKIPIQSNGEILNACIHFNLTDTLKDLIIIMTDTKQNVAASDLSATVYFFQRRPPRTIENITMHDLYQKINTLRQSKHDTHQSPERVPEIENNHYENNMFNEEKDNYISTTPPWRNNITENNYGYHTIKNTFPHNGNNYQRMDDYSILDEKNLNYHQRMLNHSVLDGSDMNIYQRMESHVAEPIKKQYLSNHKTSNIIDCNTTTFSENWRDNTDRFNNKRQHHFKNSHR